jgi:hypothetical protein
MHAAPSVTYPVGRPRLGGWLLLACWAAGAAASVLWAWDAAVAGWRQGLALAASSASGLLALRWWLAMPAGELRWDGAGWTWSGSSGHAAGRLQVGLDLQGLLLLRWQGGDEVCWLWLARGTAAPYWGDLRRAVYSRARTQALQGPQAPASKT